MATSTTATAGAAAERLPWWARPAEVLGRLDSRIASILRTDSQMIARLPGGRWIPWALLAPTVVVSLLGLGIDEVYTESRTFMALALFAGLLSPLLGVLFVTAHAVFDFVWSARLHSLLSLAVIGRLVSYWLLAILAIEVPLACRAVEATILGHVNREGRSVVAAAGSALFAASVVFIWTLAAPLLIRPVFTWAGRSPTFAAIGPLQRSGATLVAAAFVMALLASAVRARWGAMGGVSWRAARSAMLSAPLATALRIVSYALIVVAMGGIVTTLADAAVLLVALLLSGPAASLVLRRREVRDGINAIPYALRFLLGFLISLMIARVVMQVWFRPMGGSRFFPIVLSVAMGILVFAILLNGGRAASGVRGRTANDPARAALGLLAAMAALSALFMLAPFVAYAHDCSSLDDCYGSGLAAAAGAAGAAAAAGASASCAGGSTASTPGKGTKHVSTGLPPVIEFDVDYDCSQRNPQNPSAGITVGYPTVPSSVDPTTVKIVPSATSKGWRIDVSYTWYADLDNKRTPQQRNYPIDIDC